MNATNDMTWWKGEGGKVADTNGGVHPERPSRFANGTREIMPIRPSDEHLVEADVADIVHDLKNPLNAIALEAALLDDRIVRNDRHGGRLSLDRINRNVAYLDRLVLDLLDVCACAHGELRLTFETVDVSAVLTQLLDRMLGPADRLRVRLDARSPVMAVIDPLRIERVVANLVDNALKYSSPASQVVVRLTGYRGGVCVAVIDEGPGIVAEELPYVFERNHRGSSARGSRGCGIGLYVSKRIVEAHGGQLAAESLVGVGSRFFFELPAR